jgi:hypothetical protein
MTRARALAPFVLIVICYAVFRLAFLDRMIHTDERHWLGRSLNFYRAITSGEFRHTYQEAHPGVMTIWSGTLGYLVRFPEALGLAERNIAPPRTVFTHLWTWDRPPIDILIAARSAKILLQTAYFALTLVFLNSLIGRASTLLFGALLALSATLLGWDSWLHVDGLASIATFTSITAIAYAREVTTIGHKASMRVYALWGLAGFLAASAWLTRITSLILIGCVGLALIEQFVSSQFAGHSKGTTLRASLFASIRNGFSWLFGAVLGTVALFPALWVIPERAIREIVWLPISGAQGTGPEGFFPSHLRDPGWLFYPTHLLLRTTPAEWLGVIALAAGLHWARRHQVIGDSVWRLLLITLAYAVVYVLSLSISPKKYDRYLANVYPVITLFASVGLTIVTAQLSRYLGHMGKVASRVLLAGTVLYSAYCAVHSLPYKAIYNNPVSMRLLDQERSFSPLPGHDQIAEYLNAQDFDEPATVGVRNAYWGTLLEYLVPPGQVSSYPVIPKVSSPREWYSVDYQLEYGGQVPAELSASSPVAQSVVEGIVLWELYPAEDYSPPATVLAPNACTWWFGEHLALYEIYVDDRHIELYFLSLGGESATVEAFQGSGAYLRPLGRDNTPPDQEDRLVMLTLQKPVGFEDVFNIQLFAYDTETGSTLAARNWWSRGDFEFATLRSNCFQQPLPDGQGPKIAWRPDAADIATSPKGMSGEPLR